MRNVFGMFYIWGHVNVQLTVAVVIASPVTILTGSVPAVAFLGAVQVNEVALTNVVGYGIPFDQITDCRLKPVPVAVRRVVPAPDTLLAPDALVSVGAVVGDSVEAWLAFGPAASVAAVWFGPLPTVVSVTGTNMAEL